MATLMSFGFACRSCRPASRMRSGSCEALFLHEALGTALRTTTSGAPVSWRYEGPLRLSRCLRPYPVPGVSSSQWFWLGACGRGLPHGAGGLVWEAGTQASPPPLSPGRSCSFLLQPSWPFLPFPPPRLRRGRLAFPKWWLFESPLVPLPPPRHRCCCG